MIRDVERLVVAMARCLGDDDVVVVGIGTPVALAAVLLARAVHAPRLRMLMPGALDPVAANLDAYLADPTAAVAGAPVRLSRTDILDAIGGGEVSAQFVRPAQVDAQLRLNTELLHTDSGPLHLVGPVALPDVVARISRVIAYLPAHDTTTLVERVDQVTAPRDRGSVHAVVTPIAQLALASSGRPAVTQRAEHVSITDIRVRTGFALDRASDAAPVQAPPSDAELHALRTTVDPLGLIGLEDAAERRQARQTLAQLWNIPTEAPR